jgi:hypothetical protein
MKGHFSDTLIEEITGAIALENKWFCFKIEEILSFSRMHDLWARTALSAMWCEFDVS